MEKKIQFLQGWKEIEAYLRLGRRAIIARGYPVRKSLTGGVMADKKELDEWSERMAYIKEA